MKLRDRVVVGFCLSLVLVTVLFVVDLQNENARQLQAAVDADSAGSSADAGLHGRSRPNVPNSWDPAEPLPTATPAYDVQSWPRPPPRRPSAPQPYVRTPDGDRQPPTNPYAHDRFDDLVDLLSRSESVPHLGNVADWTVVTDVIVDDTSDDGTVSNEYIAEYLEDGSR